MSGEKTEKGTPKRRKEAKEKGQILKSIEVNSAVILLLCFSGLKLFGGQMVENLKLLFLNIFSSSFIHDNNGILPDYVTIYIMLVRYFFTICGPILTIAFLAGLIINYLQVGFLFLPNMLAFKFDKINPASGIKRLFSLRAIVDMTKSIFKMFVIGYIAYNEIAANYSKFANLIYADVLQTGMIVWDIILGIAFKTSVTILIMSAFDYAYQWWEYEKSLKMDKQEVKDEYKLMEGDPQIKQKIREVQRQMGMKRMMQEVPKADVVITNPIHFAVALRYDETENSAPVVIAKGQDLVAQKIKEIARNNKIEIVENRPLAQSLFRMTELGGPIPDELFHAVAEILAMVYKAKSNV